MLIAALQSFAEGTTSEREPSAGPANTEGLEPTVMKLAEYFADSDAEAIDHLASVRQMLVRAFGPIAVGELEGAASRFDFDEALACLKTRAAGLGIRV